MALNSADFDTLRGLDLAFAGLQAEANLIRLRLALKAGFDPNQPRVPAGSPHGGQWTDGAGSGGVQLAQNIPRDPMRGRIRIGAGLREATPAEETLIELTHGQADTAIRRVQQYDPYWEPTPSLFETPEGEIAANRATAKEAAEHYEWLQSGGMAPGPFARECIPAPKGVSRRFTAAQRREGNRIGRLYGCHTCGTKNPGTPSGNFILDHLISNGLIDLMKRHGCTLIAPPAAIGRDTTS